MKLISSAPKSFVKAFGESSFFFSLFSTRTLPRLVCSRYACFGVCTEGIPKQVTYLIDEAQTIGQNDTHPMTQTLLHHICIVFCAAHGQGEKKCDLNAGKCAGQNKKTIMAYLAWRASLLSEKI